VLDLAVSRHQSIEARVARSVTSQLNRHASDSARLVLLLVGEGADRIMRRLNPYGLLQQTS
jgi:hypothetical protein